MPSNGRCRKFVYSCAAHHNQIKISNNHTVVRVWSGRCCLPITCWKTSFSNSFRTRRFFLSVVVYSSDVRECRPQKKTKFQKVWKEKYAWVRDVECIYDFHCIWCKCTRGLSNMSEGTLISHMNSVKHKQKAKSFLSNQLKKYFTSNNVGHTNVQKEQVMINSVTGTLF